MTVPERPCKACPPEIQTICPDNECLLDKKPSEVAKVIDKANIETRRKRAEFLIDQIKKGLA